MADPKRTKSRDRNRPTAVVHYVDPDGRHHPEDVGCLVWYARGRWVVYWHDGAIDEVRRDGLDRPTEVVGHDFTIAVVTREPEAVARMHARCRAAFDAAMAEDAP